MANSIIGSVGEGGQNRLEDVRTIYPKKISWERNYSARYWFHSALKKS